MSRDKGAMQGIIDFTEVLGSDSFLYVKTDHGLITARENGKTEFKTGEKVFLTPIAEHIHRFDDKGKRID